MDQQTPPQPPQPSPEPAPYTPSYSAGAPPRKKGGGLLWVLMGCGALVVILLVVAVAGFFAFRHFKDKAEQHQAELFDSGNDGSEDGGTDGGYGSDGQADPAPADPYYSGLFTKLAEGDRQYVMTAGDLWPWYSDYQENWNEATIERNAYSDGTLIQYQYQDSNLGPTGLTLFSQAGYSHTAGPAMLDSLVDGIAEGLMQGGGGMVSMEDAPGLITWGEYSRAGYFVMNGNRVGFYVAGTKGPRIFTAMAFGVTLEDPEMVRQWIGPTLMNLEGWTP